MPRSDRSLKIGGARLKTYDELELLQPGQESDLREVLRVADECAAQVVEAAADGGGGGGGNQVLLKGDESNRSDPCNLKNSQNRHQLVDPPPPLIRPWEPAFS